MEKVSSTSRFHQWLGVVCHALVVFVLWGGWFAPLAWFTVTWLLVAAKPPAGHSLRRVWVGTGILALTGLLLFTRRPSLASPVFGTFGLGFLDQRAVELTSLLYFTGLSYCFLRSIYVLLDDRRWGFTSFARYWFFAP